MFDDLLMSHNFVSSHKLANRSLADLSRASEIRELSPLEIKVSYIMKFCVVSHIMEFFMNYYR